MNQTLQPLNDLPSVDIDETLANSLSSLLNISDNNPRSFLPQTLYYEYGGVGSPVAGGQGFISPGNTSLEESSISASNGVSYHHHSLYSGVGPATTPRTVDPFLRRHYNINPATLLFHNRESLPGWSTSPFDFDQRSYLLAMERLYSTQHPNTYDIRRSSNPPAAIFESGSLSRNNDFIMSRSSNLDVNRNYGGVLSNKLRNYSFLSILSLKKLRGMIYLLAKDQNGCKILKSKFETPTEEEIEIVFSEVVGSIALLMMDQSGNYLVQKLVSVCNDDQKLLIISELTESPVELILVCMSPYGIRAIKKLLENLKSKNQIMVVIRALQGGVANLANDPNGHHVLQYCLLHFDSDLNQMKSVGRLSVARYMKGIHGWAIRLKEEELDG